MDHADTVIMWLPRGDEHDLARSLGMVDTDPETLRSLVGAATERPGVTVSVRRWHVWRVVRALATIGECNTPEGRASAYAHLAAAGDH